MRCGRAMQKYGTTGAGTQRWRCAPCKQTGIKKRDDHALRSWHRRFVNWITTSTPLATIAQRLHCSLSTVTRAFNVCWQHLPATPPWNTPSLVTILDGTSLVAREEVVLIARGIRDDAQRSWVFAARETAATWSMLLASIPSPQFVVCDGQKGLLKALRMHWPTTIIQRCVIHVVRQSLAWITRNPQTLAGQQLRVIAGNILTIRTRRQRRRWTRQFRKWCRRWEAFLGTRTYNPYDKKRWWYTHRKLRRVRTLIERSLPHLFTFVRHPEVPRTSNHVEGGINARLHELFRAHRGISLIQKRILTAYFLLAKLKKKTTRNDY